MQIIPREFLESWAYGEVAPSLFVRISRLWSEMEHAVSEVVRRGLPKAEVLQDYYQRRSMQLRFDALVLASHLEPDREQDMAKIINQWIDALHGLLEPNQEPGEVPANFLMGLPGWVNQYIQHFAGVSYERRFKMVSECVRKAQRHGEWLADSEDESAHSDYHYDIAA